jgi:hypothetical protein
MPRIRASATRALALLGTLLVAVACQSTGTTGATPTKATPKVTVTTLRPTTPGVDTVDATTATWELPTPLAGAAAVPLGGGALVLGGTDEHGISSNAVIAIGPDGVARTVGTLPAAVHDAAASQVDGLVFLFGGASVTPFDLVQQWSVGPGNVVGHLSAARSGVAAATLDGRVYIAGGYDGVRLVPSIVTTTTGLRFADVGSLAQGVSGGAMAAWHDSIWMMGGTGSVLEGGLPVDTDVIQRYFRKTRTTTVVGHLPEALTGAAAVVLDDQLFLIGGEHGGVLSDNIWRIDEPGRATLVGHLPEGRANAAVVTMGPTTMWLLGGRTPQRDPAPSAVVLNAQHP